MEFKNKLEKAYQMLGFVVAGGVGMIVLGIIVEHFAWRILLIMFGVIILFKTAEIFKARFLLKKIRLEHGSLVAEFRSGDAWYFRLPDDIITFKYFEGDNSTLILNLNAQHRICIYTSNFDRGEMLKEELESMSKQWGPKYASVVEKQQGV